jgi:hypothetical protein
MPSATNLEGEETVDDPEKDGNASMPEQVKRPNPWRKMMMVMMVQLSSLQATDAENGVTHNYLQQFCFSPDIFTHVY